MIIAAAIIIGTGYLAAPEIYAQTADPEPFTGIVIDADTATPFKLVGTVMEINRGDNANVVVAEITILVTEYKFLNNILQTEVIDDYGRTIALRKLKMGQRVIVTGLELPDKTIVGQRIQAAQK